MPPNGSNHWESVFLEQTNYRGKAKYLISVTFDPVLAVFKFWFHEIFVFTKKILHLSCDISQDFCFSNNKLIIFVTKISRNCTTGVIFDPVLPPKAASI